jgi:glutathione peroxidase
MSIYDFVVQDGKKNDVSLHAYEGKVLLIVNTATGCGFTPQYKGLESLYEAYHDQGLEILDFPCNQFAGQAPGSHQEITDFCTLHYHTRFPQFNKIEVNGDGESPLYTFLKEKQKGAMGSRIKWNFTKFLVSRKGEVVARYAPNEEPSSFEKKIQELLQEK